MTKKKLLALHCAVICIAAAVSLSAQASSKYWRNGPGCNTDWNATCWVGDTANPSSVAAPVAGDDVYLINYPANGTPSSANLNYAGPSGPAPVFRNFTLGAAKRFTQQQGNFASDSESVGGYFLQKGGANAVTYSLRIGSSSEGTYRLEKGTLSATDIVVGWSDIGIFSQGAIGAADTAAVVTVSNSLVVGRNTTSSMSADYWMESGSLQAKSEIVGDNGYAEMGQSGGVNSVQETLTVGKGIAGRGSYVLTNQTAESPRLNAKNEVLGDEGRGIFYHNTGVNTVSDTLVLGRQAGGYGEYRLFGGAVTAAKEIVGDAGQGTFTQGQGSFGYSTSNTVNGTLTLGKQANSNGVYTLIAGALTAIDEIIGDGGTGSLSQQSGSNTASGKLVLGKQAGSQGTYELGNGSLSVGETIIGDAGTGKFIHKNTNGTGSTHTVGGVLTLGKQASGRGTYDLIGGVLTTAHTVVGDAGIGTFNQSGGTHNTTNLTLGRQAGSTGTYNLSGGNLNVAGNIVNGAGTGSLLISGGALNFGAGNHDVDVDVLKLSDQGVINLTNGATTTFQKAVEHNGKAINLEAGTNAIFNAAFSGKGPFTGKGTATFNSVLNVGDGPATFSVAGNMVLGEHSKSIMEIAGDERGSEYDAVDVGGSLTLGGELNLVALAGFTGQLGDVFDLYKAETIFGEFDLLSLLVLGDGLAWKIEYLVDAVGTTDIVRLSVVSSVPLPASVWLLQSALLGLFAARRLRAKKSR